MMRFVVIAALAFVGVVGIFGITRLGNAQETISGAVVEPTIEPTATVDAMAVRVAELEATVAALEADIATREGVGPIGTVRLQCGPDYFAGIGDVALVTGTDFIDGPPNEGSLNPSRPQTIEVVTGAVLTSIDATCTISLP